MADSAMDKTVTTVDDDEAAANGSSGHRHAGTPGETVAAAEREHSPGDRTPHPQQRGRPARPRESLHEWIVHFDAERSFGPPAWSDEQ
jgi:hypothetical protein